MSTYRLALNDKSYIYSPGYSGNRIGPISYNVNINYTI